MARRFPGVVVDDFGQPERQEDMAAEAPNAANRRFPGQIVADASPPAVQQTPTVQQAPDGPTSNRRQRRIRRQEELPESAFDMTDAQFEEAQRRRSAEMPEIGTQGIRSVAPEAGVPTAMAALTTTDSAIRPRDESGAFVPSELSMMLKQADPDVEIIYTPEGEERAYNPKTKELVSLNKLGVSPIDIMRTLGITSALAPTVKMGSLGSRLATQTAAGAATAGATQTLIEGAQEAAGGTADLKAIGTATLGGGAVPAVTSTVKAAGTALLNRFGNKIPGKNREIVEAILSDPNPSITDRNTLWGADTLIGNKTAATRVEKSVSAGVDRSNALAFVGSPEKNREVFSQTLRTAKAASKGKSLQASRNHTNALGKRVLARWDRMKELNKKAGEEIDRVAENVLKGQQVDMRAIHDGFMSSMKDLGVRLDPNTGKFVYDSTSIRELNPAREMLEKAWRVTAGAKGDAYTLHRAKRIIDEVVTYGKPLEGITGNTESQVRKLRGLINETLQNVSDDYRIANKKYSTGITALNRFRDATKGAFDPDDKMSEDIMGLIIKDVNVKTPRSLRLKEVTDGLEDAIETVGGKSFEDDLATQALFNSEVEDALNVTYEGLGEELMRVMPLEGSRFARNDKASSTADLGIRIIRKTLFQPDPSVKKLKALEKLVETR